MKGRMGDGGLVWVRKMSGEKCLGVAEVRMRAV